MVPLWLIVPPSPVKVSVFLDVIAGCIIAFPRTPADVQGARRLCDLQGGIEGRRLLSVFAPLVFGRELTAKVPEVLPDTPGVNEAGGVWLPAEAVRLKVPLWSGSVAVLPKSPEPTAVVRLPPLLRFKVPSTIT